MKPQHNPSIGIVGGGSTANMRVLKSPRVRKSSSRAMANDLLTGLLVKGNKAEDILRRFIRKIILEELNFLIDLSNQKQNEFSFGYSEKLPVVLLNNYRKLTGKEIEVMDLILLGFSNRKIAARLKMKYSTVRNHVKSINNKFGVNEREASCSVYRKLYNKPGLTLK
jgi:DNA-binding CsgD family transcriptional regulator